MSGPELGRRFWESTRGQIVTLVRRGALTVEELAQELGVTDNAVRSHLTVLERDGLLRQVGVRRVAGAGKPAVLYELHPDAAPLFSKAYEPVLTVMMDVLAEELTRAKSDKVLREVGKRIAQSVGGRAAGTRDQRIRAAADVLIALGGDVVVEKASTKAGKKSDAEQIIRGTGCPLSKVVARRPETCHLIESLVTEVAGEPAEMRCDHGAQPKCRFAI